LAAIGMTGEYRHRTATTTFLATPHRGHVVAAKLVAYSLVGIGYALACTAVTLYALIGVGLGALLREQVATVVGLLIYLLVLEPILTNIPALDTWTRYLPGPADNALSGITLTNQQFLQPWQGGLVLTAYCLIIAAAGTYLASRKDIT
ncbi:MAG TPA: hypothetical protein VFX60_12670, partial [Micromonospora sp.]|nr:hypothetical protein [Micromonospora sp.]